ncbi:hypothetical protein GT002_15125, partial [Streptomyces sp. SID4917]|nr:hypothetical protein [Streptomyces sp. SID4917]
PVGSGTDLDGLSAARTAAGITGLLVDLLAGPAETAAAAPVPAPSVEPSTTVEAEILAPQRLEFSEFELPEVTGSVQSGSTVLLLGGGELAPVVAERLRAAGALPTLVPAGELPETTADAVIHLDALDTADSPLPEAFPLYQSVLAGAPRRLLAVERRTEGAASGLRGFFRSVAREYPDLIATLVEVAADAGPEEVAAALATELAATDREPVVLTGAGTRRALRLIPTDLGAL